MSNAAVAANASHNRTSSEPPSRSRSVFIRAARTNNPWAVPPGLPGPDARRYRDLMHEYRGRLGLRAERQDVQARLRSLVWLSIELERLQDERLRGASVPIHTVIHATQELRTLLAELGLTNQYSGEPQPELHDYLRDKSGVVPP